MILSNPHLFNALAATPVLTGINPAALSLLAAEGRVHEFKLGDLIVQEGDSGNSLFILVEGAVEIIKNYNTPNAVLLATLHSRTFFGEMCVIDPVPRAATARALGNVTALEIKASTLYHLFQKLPDQYAIVLLNLARDMARRLRQLDEAFAALTS